MTGPAPSCGQHPGVPAGWRCTRCGALLCPDCTGRKRLGTGVLPSCMRCNELAEVLKVLQKEKRSFASALPGAFLLPLSARGVIALLSLGILLRILELAGAVGVLVGQGLLWSYVFSLARDGARGKDGIEPPDFLHVWDGIFKPIVLVLAVGALLWVPALLVRGSFVGFVFIPAAAAAKFLPVVGLLYLPIGLLVAATTDSILRAANPVIGLPFAVRLGVDYLLLLALLAALAVSYAVLSFVALAISFIPWIGPVLGMMILAYPFLVLGRAMGLLLQARGADLGYTDERESWVPALGDTAPRGPETTVQPTTRK